MKKILFALTAVAALGATQTTFADSVGANELARTQELISELQADKRQVMLDTLALNPEQLILRRTVKVSCVCSDLLYVGQSGVHGEIANAHVFEHALA